MVVYEVMATVDPRLAPTFERYMRGGHIPDLMASGCFVSAEFLRDDVGYEIRYKAADRASLDRYIADHAPRLRAELLEYFPTGVELSRRIFDVLSEFPPSQ
jgi:hypothetical protein